MANISIALSPLCTPDEKYRMLSASLTEMYFFRYVFPALALVGIAGNSLNMVVLRAKEMSRAYTLFFVLAVTDVLFFLSFLPTWLGSYGPVAANLIFRQLFLPANIHLTGLANWLSAFNNMTVAMISVERYIAVRYPFKIETLPAVGKPLVVFVVVSLACTSHVHFSTKCVEKYKCNDTQLIQSCMDKTLIMELRNNASKRPSYNASEQLLNDISDWANNSSDSIPTNSTDRPKNSFNWLHTSIMVGRYAHAVGLSLSLLVIIVCNALLIRHSCIGGFDFRGTEIDRSIPSDEQPELGRRHTSMNAKNTEKQVTKMAMVIISVFFAINVPSAIALAISAHSPTNHSSMNEEERGRYYFRLTCTIITICGKTVNFFLFCICSETFFSQIKDIILRRQSPEATHAVILQELSRSNTVSRSIRVRETIDLSRSDTVREIETVNL